MRKLSAKLSPGLQDPMEERRRLIEWWGSLRIREGSGETTWEVLDALETEVTECLDRDIPDVEKAAELTAKAAHLLTGSSNL